MPAALGNRNALKPPSKRLSVDLRVRCTRKEKREWLAAAKGAGARSPSAWARRLLNQAAADVDS